MSVGKYRDPVTGEWKKVGGSAGSIPSKLPNPYPLTINGTQYDGSKKLEVNTKELVVTVTGTQESGYTADKTYDDVLAALDAGRTVVCLFNGEMFVGFRVPLAMIDDGMLMFVVSPIGGACIQIMLAGATVSAAETLLDVTIGDQIWDMGKSVDFTDTINNMIAAKIPTALPNPNTLTINGTSYDGSEAVEVNIPKGDTGQRGTGLLAVTTGPASYTTAVGGITPKYRMEISTIKTQAGVTEVLLGDTVRYSYYHYPIAYLDASYAYFTTRVSIRGATGAAGAAGSDATVTKESIETALGYTPVSPDDIPASGDNVPDYVRTEAERVAAVVQERQNENTITAILSSDYHLPNPSHTWYKQILEGITHAGQAMGILRNQVNIDFEAKLGDLIYDLNETQEEALASFRMVHSLTADSGADRFEANGNHDHLQSNATPFTHAQVYANNGIYNKGCVRDTENRVGGYCYRDYEEFKLRVVLLNTSEATDGSFALSSAQLAWLDTAFDVPVEEGWGILILSHHPLDWGGSNTAVMKKIKAASGIIANLHGHVHTYTQDVITGTDIPRLAIPNACFYRNNEYGQNAGAENSEGIEFGTTTTYNKTAGTANDTAFCVLTLDRDAGMLYLDKYGAGIDREAVVRTWAKKASNLVESAVEMDSTAIYNGGKGYKDRYYLTGETSNFENGDNNTFVTGFMPYTVETSGVPGTIYIKGAEWTANSHCRMFFFDENKGAIVGPQISGSGTGNASIDTHYTREVENGVTKLTPIANSSGNWVAISKAASITNARFFRLSLEGTGANLFVTINEPIE